MSDNKNLPAFPTSSGYIDVPDTGLNKREYFAGLAMQGMIANSAVFMADDLGQLSEKAVMCADRLLTELSKS